MTAPRFATALLAALLASPLCGAQAEDYPVRPVKIIVPFGAGGPADVAARLVGNVFQESHGPALRDREPHRRGRRDRHAGSREGAA